MANEFQNGIAFTALPSKGSGGVPIGWGTAAIGIAGGFGGGFGAGGGFPCGGTGAGWIAICCSGSVIPPEGRLCEVIGIDVELVGIAGADKLVVLNEGPPAIAEGMALCFPLETGGVGNVPASADEDWE